MNLNLALSDETLLSIEKPERYIGNEVNCVMKDKEQVDIRFAFCFPDVYEIGMSHLGIQILYGMFNSYDDVWCERVYSPWMDMDAVMRRDNIPLFALESQEPVKDFDFLGFTLQYEMCYTNILQILDLSGVPFLASERTWDDPIVIGGGPCSYNPEPIADFFDLFYIGEGETRYRELFDLYKKAKKDGMTREDFLHEAAKIPGMYVPAFYEVKYKEDGTILSMEPIFDDIPRTIEKEMCLDLSEAYYPTKPVVPYIKVTQDRVTLEIMRGCIRGCRFCQAGMNYRPVRERSKDEVVSIAKDQLADSGHQEVSVLSLSTSDYSEFEPMVLELMDYCRPRQIGISLPSLRMDNFSFRILDELQGVRKTGLTFAAEAGTQRLRDVINKNVTEEHIMTALSRAMEMGWNAVKIYFMMGLPTETYEDLDGIVDLASRIMELAKEKREFTHGRFNVNISVSNFVPKPDTPFMWCAQNTEEEFEKKHVYLRDRLRKIKGVNYRYHGSYGSHLEALLARGGRYLCGALLCAFEKYGCFFDAWTESFNIQGWKSALRECGIGEDDPAYGPLDPADPQPWEIIDCGIKKEFFLREWERAQRGETTPDCRYGCNDCGINAHATCRFAGSLTAVKEGSEAAR